MPFNIKTVSTAILTFNINHRVIDTKMQAKQYTVCTYQKTNMFPLHPKMPETRLRIALMMQKTSPLPLGGTGEI